MKNAKTLLLVLGSLLLLLAVGTAGALPPRITWDPNSLVTAEIAPGEGASYTVTLKNTGLLPILAAYQLRIVAEGGIVPYATIEQPKFPNTFKPGQSVTFSVNLSVPDNTPAGEVKGSLVLKRIIRNKVVDVWRVEALPVNMQVVEIGTGPDAISVNTQVYEGRIDLPFGVGPALATLRVKSGIGGIAPVSADGRFQARMNVEATALLRVADSDNNTYLIKLFPKSEELKAENPIIDAKSTAVALMALQPGVITTDPIIDAVILALLESLPEIDILADQIAREVSAGSFRVNSEFSPALLGALRHASYAISIVSYEDLLARTFSGRLKLLLATLFRHAITPAKADVTFGNPCTDLYSDRFSGDSDNKDGVCIGAESSNLGRNTTFYFSNPRTRWVFFGEKESASDFDFGDLIPPRHIDFPSAQDILWDLGKEIVYIIIDLFKDDKQAGALERYYDRLDSRFGPARSQATISYEDGEHALATVGYAGEQLGNPPLLPYYGSFALTVISEGVLPWVSVVADMGAPPLAQMLEARGILGCANTYGEWISRTAIEYIRIVSSEVTPSKLAEWFVKDVALDLDSYAFIECASTRSLSAYLQLGGAANTLIELFGTGPLGWFNKLSAITDATFNSAFMLREFSDPSLSSIDFYTLTVGTPPTATLVAAPSSIVAGQSAALSWSSTNATGCEGTGFSTDGSTSGTVAVSPVATTMYSLKCMGAAGDATASATVEVTAAPEQPTATLSASPPSITEGQSSTLSWSSTNANACDGEGDGFLTGGSTSGTDSVSPTATATYTVICTGPGGNSDPATATVTVTAAPPVGTFSIDPPSATVGEGAGSVSFTVTRSDGTAAQTVYVSTVQNQGSTNNGDYVGKLNEAVRFAAGQTQQFLTVTITDDTAVEANETFGLLVEDVPDGNVLAAATFTISDDDAGGVGACDVGNSVVPCEIDGVTYDTFAGNYTQSRVFYRAGSYNVSIDGEYLSFTIKESLPHIDGFAYVAGYFPGVIAWTSPAPYSVDFHIFGAFGGAIVKLADHFEWVGVGSADLPSKNFLSGDAVEVTETGVNVRSEPSGEILGTQSPGVPGVLISGPSYAGGYWWWQVEFEDGVVGWVAEEFLQKVGEQPTGCGWGTPLSNIVIPEVRRVVSFDGSGFDATRTTSATWVENGGVEYLYYAGLPFGNTQDLGLATSSDGGLTWAKATDVPLISRATAPYWATFRIKPVSALHENGLYRLWYSGNNANSFSDEENIHGFGYAASVDGLTWTLDEDPIRVEAGILEGARLREVVKLGGRYLAIYDDLTGLREVTYLATFLDGIAFEDNDSVIPFGSEYRLAAATTSPINETCILGIWQNRANATYVATTSTDGVNFEVVSDVQFPAGFEPEDIRIVGDNVVFYGNQYEGNVNWSFGNNSIATARVPVFVGD